MAHPDPEQLVRDSVEAGMTLAAVAALLRSEDVGPIDAVKALKHGAGVPLGEGKVWVDNSLPPAWRAANERLRDIAERTMREA